MMQKINSEPNLFVFDDVDPFLKATGRAVQVPEGFPHAGGWMIISPFNRTPWKSLTGAPSGVTQEEILLGGKPKEGFIETHGKVPADSNERRIWKDAHPAFVKAGVPDEVASAFNVPAMLTYSEQESTRWGFGPARPYVNRYGGFVRFPESSVPSFEVPLWTWLFDPDQVGATFQMVEARKTGKPPARWHPGVPEVFKTNIGEA